MAFVAPALKLLVYNVVLIGLAITFCRKFRKPHTSVRV